MSGYKSAAELLERTKATGCSIGELVIMDQSQTLGLETTAVVERMTANWQVMREAMRIGLTEEIKSRSGLVGGEGRRVEQARQQGKLLAGDPVDKTIARALAVAEYNAAMGKIVAAPTAGSCGVLPAVLATVGEKVNASDKDIVKAMFTAAGLGMVIAYRATLSGAVGGCQAECGSASCMAAMAAVELAGGTPEQAANAGAIALQNLLGLVCDPVAGLVEVPCTKRNAAAAVNALAAADMALAGITSFIPLDEVIDAMGEIGRALPCGLRETSEMGLANTPTARQFETGFNERPDGV